jgi:glycosyltransferase involved in cell wall biosynthesis
MVLKCALVSLLTGYGVETARWCRRLPEIGHEVIVSAFHGLGGSPLAWNGVTVLPGSFPGDMYGSAILPQHVAKHGADLALTLMDVWVMNPQDVKGMPLACWMPSDSEPLSSADRTFLAESGAIPIAMTRTGERRLREAGFGPLYVPHALDLDTWKPGGNREETRSALGIAGKFAIGINANNKDSFRKGMWEQLAAFARLRAAHDDAVLLIHGLVHEPGSVDLSQMVARLGLAGSVMFCPQYEYLTGMITEQSVAGWHAALDLYSQCSFGEGFGITALQSQAVGVPVVVTDAGAMSELCGGGWKVPGEDFWNPVHNACWTRPSIAGIHRAYEQAYQRGKAYEARKAKCVPFAAQYDADLVLRDYWAPCLKEIEARLGERKAAA